MSNSTNVIDIVNNTKNNIYYNAGIIVIGTVCFIPFIILMLKSLYYKRFKTVVAYPIGNAIYIQNQQLDIEFQDLPVATLKQNIVPG